MMKCIALSNYLYIISWFPPYYYSCAEFGFATLSACPTDRRQRIIPRKLIVAEIQLDGKVGYAMEIERKPGKNETISVLILAKSGYGKMTLDEFNIFIKQCVEKNCWPTREDTRIYGYSAYNPETIVKMLGIFRVFYNYCLTGKDGKTPSMRLGLAKGKVSLEDIIYF